MTDQESVGRRRASGDGDATTLGLPLSGRLLLFVGVPVLMVLLGLLLPPLARLLLDRFDGLPVRPVFRFLGAVDRPWELAVNLAVWLAAGLAVAVTAVAESMTVTVTDTELLVRGDGRQRTVPRRDVSAVFLDGRQLVVLDTGSRQAVRGAHEASADDLAAAFRRHGYPWHAHDPYADLFRRWVPDSGHLPPPVDAVLAARGTALRKKARTEARELRDAVEKLGFVVRDEGDRQFWRPLVRP